ncbi:MAG TPA: MoaD/ThiS family protein [Desulfobacteria bacterium]|nr:MoaD/ThiS family protein [Desulfobacteria bacterium]
MKLEIRLFAGLKCNNRELPCFGENEFYLEVPEGMTVDELHRMLNLQLSLPLVNLINGLAQADDWVLADNDRVGIFPPVGGG